jgi:hypothetical protein|tara:strand:+ start:663 stop:845 length:183 start_codon:yes stop_codon:yes gene_type:complete
MVAEGDVKLISPEEFHSRKTHQILQRWEYGMITEQEMIDSMMLLGYDKEVILDILEGEEE